MLRLLNAPEAREPRTGRQPTTTEADVRPLRSFFEALLPARGIAANAAMLTLRLYFRRHFKAATSVPPLDHVRVRPGAEYALRADFFQSMFCTQPNFNNPANGARRVSGMSLTAPDFCDPFYGRIIGFSPRSPLRKAAAGMA